LNHYNGDMLAVPPRSNSSNSTTQASAKNLPAALSTQHSALSTSIFVWGTWTVMSVLALGLVAFYGSNVPYVDDWEMVPFLTGEQPVTLAWLWSEHNEHRTVIPRLLLLGVFHAGRRDFRSGMALSGVGLAGLAAGMILAARKVRGRIAWTDAFFPLVLLHWGHEDNLLWFWQVGFVGTTVIAGFLLILIVRSGADLKRPAVVGAGLLLLLLPLCGANGLVFGPPLVVWLLVCAWEARNGNRSWALMGLFAVLVAALCGLYFVGYHPPSMPSRKGATECLHIALEFLSCGLGRPLTLANENWWFLWAGAIVGCTAMWTLACARAWFRQPPERCRAFGLACFLGAIVGLAIGLGWGRSGFGVGTGYSRRYITLAAPLVCCGYFVALLYLRPVWSRLFQAGLLAAALLMLYPNTVRGLREARALHDNKVAHFLADLRAGHPPMVLSERYTRPPLALALPQQQPIVAEALAMLARAGVGEFGLMRPDPLYRSVSVNETTISSTGGEVYKLTVPRFVYAIRLKYRYRPLRPLANFALVWKSNTQPSEGRVVSQTLSQDQQEHSLILWVNDMVSEFTLYPDNEPHLCEIKDDEVLVPKT
jgi:hypothetical protein